MKIEDAKLGLEVEFYGKGKIRGLETREFFVLTTALK